MTPSQIKQALKIRVLRADKAERLFNQARAVEAEAMNALNQAQWQLENFDTSYEQRIEAFFLRTSTGLSPDTLHSTRTFHADLVLEREGIVVVIEKAEHAFAVANQHVAERRTEWAAASRAADNLRELYDKKVSAEKRDQERREEMDADELSIARAYRDAG